MSVNVTQFTVREPSQEVTSVTAVAEPLDFSALEEKRKKRVIHRSSKTSTEIVLSILEANQGAARFDVIQRAVLDHGFAHNTVNAALSKLKTTGKVAKRVRGKAVYWEKLNDRER